MTRVALCITELEVGGAERALVRLATGLDRDRFQPVVYSLGPRPVGKQQLLADELDRAGIATHFLGATRPWHARRTLRELTKLFRAQQPDVVQSFLFHANVLATLAARRAGVPRVLTGIRVAERRAAWHRWLEKRVAPRVDWHVCVSQAVADFSAAVTGLDRQKLVVIPNSVDGPRFAAAKPVALEPLGVPPGRRVVTFAGRLTPQKGLDWLLRQCPAFFAAQTSHDLLVVGRGPEEQLLVWLAAQGGVSGRVHFAGWQSDVPAILAASDVVLLPSRWEGMSNLLLEAMAAGRPIVATDVEGAREALGPAAADQLVRADDAQGFVDNLLAVLGDASLAARLGAENQARAASEFAPAQMLAAYERLFLARD